MKARLNYLQRLFGTGFSFFMFGFGGLILGLVVFPLLRLLSPDQEKRQQRAQWVIHKSFAFFIGLMEVLGVMRLERQHVERLRHSRGELIVANHPSLLDVVALIACMPRADCIVKSALWRNPFTRGPVQAAGYILNGDDSTALIDACVQRLQEGHSLIIFPEGTRTERGCPLNGFQRGAANIAARAGAPCRPVLIHCNPTTLTKNENWYRIPARRFVLTLDVREPVALSTLLADAPKPSVAARRINTFLENFFDGEINSHERAGTGTQGTDYQQPGAGRYPA